MAEPPPLSAAQDARPRPGAAAGLRQEPLGAAGAAAASPGCGAAAGLCRSGVGACPPGSAGLGVRSGRKKRGVSGVKAGRERCFYWGYKMEVMARGGGGGVCHI